MKIDAKFFTALMMVLTVSSVVCAGDLNIELNEASPKAGESLCALVSIETGKDALGAFHLELTFNPQDFVLERVERGGNLYFGDLSSSIDNTKGIVKIASFQGISMTEPVGTIPLAKLFLKPKKGHLAKKLFDPSHVEFVTPSGDQIKID